MDHLSTDHFPPMPGPERVSLEADLAGVRADRGDGDDADEVAHGRPQKFEMRSGILGKYMDRPAEVMMTG